MDDGDRQSSLSSGVRALLLHRRSVACAGVEIKAGEAVRVGDLRVGVESSEVLSRPIRDGG